ncbi:MAG TPA: hypothetical protein VKT51_06220, partial [Candidatus Eremiobacteraceae bacterium]|nr:hypothetical protein [Candidatus Eremiobacteraceae bacterium]
AAIAYFLISALLTPDNAGGGNQQQLEMSRIVGQGARGNQVGWRFSADSSDISTDGMVTTYHHVRNATYFLHGAPAFKLTASNLTLDLRTQNYTGYGGVHIWSVRKNDLEDIKTTTVAWNNPLQLLTCPEPVHVRYKGYEMTSARLTWNFLTGESSLGQTSIHANG